MGDDAKSRAWASFSRPYKRQYNDREAQGDALYFLSGNLATEKRLAYRMASNKR